MSCSRKGEVPECPKCKHAQRGGRQIDPLIQRAENKHGQVLKQVCLNYREKR